MERSVSVSSDRNLIRDHLWRWSTYFGWNIPTEIRRSIFDKLVHCSTSLHLCRECGKAIKNDKNHSSWLAGFDRKISFRFLWYSQWFLTDWFGIMEAAPFFWLIIPQNHSKVFKTKTIFRSSFIFKKTLFCGNVAE